MGVIARQGAKYSIIGYLGYLLGTIAAIFLFPRNMEFFGKLRYALSQAEILAPFVVFGISYSNVKFFNEAEKNDKHQNMLFISVLSVILNFLLFTLGFFIFYKIFSNYQDSQSWHFRNVILPLVFLLSISAVFNKYLSNFKRIAVANIFENIFPKLANIAAFCLFFYVGSAKLSFVVFISFFVLALVGYILYTNNLQTLKPDFSVSFFRKNNFYQRFFNYSFFGFLGNIGNYIAIRIDMIMIAEYMHFKDNGAYSILYSIISLISIPQLGLFTISAPVIGKAIEENKFEDLDKFHKKTSLSLFFLGAVFFCCILVGFPYLTHFIKNGEILRNLSPVIWILGAATMFDLATGFNGNIISMSKYYRFNIVIMLVLAALTIFLNYLFLSKTSLGLIGVSIATATSLFLYNVVKIIFNYVKFKVMPLSFGMVYITLFSALAVTVCVILPDFRNNFLNLIYKPLITLFIIFTANYFLNIVPVSEYISKDFLLNLLGRKKS